MKSQEKRLKIQKGVPPGHENVALKVQNCVCGSSARLQSICTIEYFVVCTSDNVGRTGQPCWTGPCRERQYEAIEAWNDVMEAMAYLT